MRLIILLFLLTGCATFKTDQLDQSVFATYENGQLISVETRTIRSRAKARAFFEGSSKLSGFKATQTDKTQSSSIGELNQQVSATNLTEIIKVTSEAAVKGALEYLAPK